MTHQIKHSLSVIHMFLGRDSLEGSDRLFSSMLSLVQVEPRVSRDQ